MFLFIGFYTYVYIVIIVVLVWWARIIGVQISFSVSDVMGCVCFIGFYSMRLAAVCRYVQACVFNAAACRCACMFAFLAVYRFATIALFR